MKLRIATLAAAAALIAAPALAQMGHGPHGPGPGPGPGGHHSITQMAEELGLTAEQTAQIKAVEKKYRDGELGDLTDSVRDAQRTLAATIHDAAATDDAVTQAAAAVAAIESRIAVQRHRLVVEVSALLTEEQKAQLAEMKPGPGKGPRHAR